MAPDPLAPMSPPGARLAGPEMRTRRLLQLAVRLLAWAGILLVGAGAIVAGILSAVAERYEPTERLALAVDALLSLGPLVLGLAVAAAHPLDRFIGRRRQEGRPTAEAHLWTRLKVGGLLLNLLGAVTAAVLAVALLVRFGVFANPMAGVGVHRGVLVLVAGMGIAHGYTLLAALRVGLPRERSGVRFIVATASLVAVALLCGVAVALAVGQGSLVAGALVSEKGDLPFVTLGAQGAAAIALAASRGLPGVPGLLQQGRLGRTAPFATRRSVLLPVLAAFALLFLVFLLFILFGVGVVGFVQQVAASPLLLGTLVFLLLAFVASILGAFGLSRQEAAEPPLYRRPADRKRRREQWILGVSVGAALLVAAPAVLLLQGYPFLGFSPSAWIHFACVGLLVGLGPYGFYQAHEHRRIRLLEERFPDFLRDIASSHKGGLTLTQAAVIASRGEYGPLTPEVQKMSDQLRWNVSFNEALQRFSQRVRTPLVQRAVSLILQANKSGGATTEVLLAAARDAREIKTLENERKVSMSLYTVVIYVTFFVFLGVAAIMYSQFIPQLVAANQAAAEAAGAVGAGVRSLAGGGLRLEDFQVFYFLAALVQGVGDGIVAGLMGQGKAVLGLRHSFLMVLFSYVTFTFLLA